MELKRKKNRYPKYRVVSKAKYDKLYWSVEEKSWIFGGWYHVARSTEDDIEEAIAIKTLLENGHSHYTIYRPTEECKRLGLQFNP